MSLGTGLFMGIALAALVYLYVHTRDRWKWRRIMGVSALIVALPLAALGVYIGYETWSSSRVAKPARVNSYAGVTIGQSKGEVIYALGRPSSVLETEIHTEKEGPWKKYRLNKVVEPKDGTAELSKYNAWQYESPVTGRLDVAFDSDSESGVVSVIGCYSSTHGDCPDLLGVSAGATEDSLVATLGQPDTAALDPDSSVKTLTYTKLNASFVLSMRRVYMLRVGALPPVQPPRDP
jgi:hypothetical protein